MKIFLFMVLPLAIGAVFCNIPISSDIVQPTPEKTINPAATTTSDFPGQSSVTPSLASPEGSAEPPPEIPHGQLIYSNSLTADWPPYSNDRGSGQSTEAGYEMTLASDEQWGNWIYSSVIEEETFYTIVNINFSECSAEICAAGLLFHYSTPESYKYFILSPSGAFSVIERSEGEQGVLLLRGEIPEQVMRASDAISISLLTIDGFFTFFVNGVQVGKVELSSSTAGDIGLYIQTTGGRTTALFSDLGVFAPD